VNTQSILRMIRSAAATIAPVRKEGLLRLPNRSGDQGQAVEEYASCLPWPGVYRGDGSSNQFEHQPCFLAGGESISSDRRREGRLLVDADDSKSENFEQPAVDRPRRRRGRMLAPFFLFVFLLTSVDINRSAGSTNRWACQPEAAPRLQCHHSSGRARRMVP
jgi:hypothetical protein